MLSEIWAAIRHNQATVVATMMVFAVVFWFYGCQSTSLSPLTGKPATSGQLAAEADKYAADLALAFDDIERQDAFKQQIANLVATSAQAGTINPLGIGLGALGLLTSGLLVDNRRKDAVIKSKSNAIASLAPQESQKM